MNEDRIMRAARNNAAWCDLVCRTHGIPGAFVDGAWVNPCPTPRFYPNMVTLTGAEAAGRHMELVRELMTAGLPEGWGVKDSFSALDLTSLGFHVLFEAKWIYRPASCPKPGISTVGVDFLRLSEESELVEWERAWAGLPYGVGEGGTDRIFLPPLLGDENVVVWAACRGDRIVSGAIANRDAGAVGVSNFFAPEGCAREYLAGFVSLAVDNYPGLPLVGYEREQDREPFPALGFETIGPLRVWI